MVVVPSFLSCSLGTLSLFHFVGRPTGPSPNGSALPSTQPRSAWCPPAGGCRCTSAGAGLLRRASAPPSGAWTAPAPAPACPGSNVHPTPRTARVKWGALWAAAASDPRVPTTARHPPEPATRSVARVGAGCGETLLSRARRSRRWHVRRRVTACTVTGYVGRKWRGAVGESRSDTRPA